jgi:DNA-binding beta-propeller fold protein YncE
MSEFWLRSIACASLLWSSLFLGCARADQAMPAFAPLHRHVIEGSAAEIVAASSDGNRIAYTNKDEKEVGLLDIRNPQNPETQAIIDVSNLGEPTAVAITPNDRYALVTILDTTATIEAQQPGMLVFIDLERQEIAAQLQLSGIGPDNLKITPDGNLAIIALEDEEDTDNLPGSRPGSIDLVAINYSNPSQSTITNLAVDLSDIPGVNYANDPQPEFVAIAPNGQTAAVSLQENNAIAILDLASQRITRIFSTGVTRHAADLSKDGEIDFSQPFQGRREPDSIVFTSDGRYLLTANEGDTSLDSFGDNIYSGGRGWSIFDLEGNLIYDSGSSLEQLAASYGHYPDSRSENRGIEVEGIEVGRFGDRDFAFVASERGSFLAIYDLSDIKNPQLLSFYPTGLAPEGILALPQRNLVLTANENDGTIDFFQATPTATSAYSSDQPLVKSSSETLSFGALSGLASVPGTADRLYAVPDNAMKPSRIFTLTLNGSEALVSSALPLTRDGQPVAYDLEGIAVNPNGGFWLVSEGDDREGQESPNLLLQVSDRGGVEAEIPLPDAAASQITRFGFEGVATNADGTQVYVALQRPFTGEERARIGVYDTARQTWTFYYYSLDTDNVGGWVGLSEIALDTDGSLVAIERDNQGGENKAQNVRIKRIYRFSLAGVEPGETVEKELVADLYRDYNWYEEKVEGLAVTEKGYWVVSDNDGGATYTRLLFVPRRDR